MTVFNDYSHLWMVMKAETFCRQYLKLLMNHSNKGAVREGMSYFFSQKSLKLVAALKNVLTGSSCEAISSPGSHLTPLKSVGSAKKNKRPPFAEDDLHMDIVAEDMIDTTQVNVQNTCGFAFQWRDISSDVNKVTSVINVPSGVDPRSISTHLIPEDLSIHSSKILQIKFE